jgi:hypothetical protein
MSKEMVPIETIQQVLDDAAGVTLSGGSFKETVILASKQQITFEFSLAVGWAWNASRSSYKVRFGILPDWVLLLHPIHRVTLCKLSIDIDQELPDVIDNQILEFYVSSIFDGGRLKSSSMVSENINANEGVQDMSKPKSAKAKEPVIDFDVNSSGTLSLSNFTEFETRSEFYDSISGSWSQSPGDLAEAMDECPPLSWAVHSIYSEIREEVQFDFDATTGQSGILAKRSNALKARLNAMPEEPEEGAESWLLTLINSEFEDHVVPEIEKWFDSPPNWNWEDDYLPKDSTSQGAALEFFQRMDGDDLDVIGVVIVEGEHPGSTYYAAELKVDLETANKAAIKAGIPVRFIRTDE